MDERVKHRIVGLAVIISIGVILAPAIIRKSNQRIDAKTRTTFHIPKKPLHPKVVVKEKEEVFKSVKIAHVSLDLPKPHPVTTIAKAKPIIQTKTLATQEKTLPAPENKATPKSKTYAVQLASFTQRKNAKSLVDKLQKEGFKASYNQAKSKSTGHNIYKVIVGSVKERDKAKQLKKQLAKATKLQGIVITNKIS